MRFDKKIGFCLHYLDFHYHRRIFRPPGDSDLYSFVKYRYSLFSVVKLCSVTSGFSLAVSALCYCSAVSMLPAITDIFDITVKFQPVYWNYLSDCVLF